MASTFHIVLTQEEGYDAHKTREFDLELDSKFAIGRASKNVSKGYLLPAKTNVYIDSPVVSREHATLTANAASGTPHVYITDTKSMHGTYVNGDPLEPHTPRQLTNGDKLQFGVNVNRNENYFVAFQYTFSADLSTAVSNTELSNDEPFSRGFTVPEAESEDEELAPAPAGSGSQRHPLIVDDSDAASEHEEHEREAGQSENNADVTLAQLETGEEVPDIDTMSLPEEEDDADSIAGYSIDSDAASAGSNSEDEPESPLLEAHFIEAVQAAPAGRDQPSASSFDFEFSPAAETYDADHQMRPQAQTLSPPAWQTIDHHVTFPSTTLDSTLAPPLPPRPSQKRQRIWDEPQHEDQGWMLGTSSDVPSWSPLALPAWESRAQVYEFVPLSPLAEPRIQTPPPTVSTKTAISAPALVESSTRRTGVSIEIVDEQPPTPTSINSRKRSAGDAFDDDSEDVIEQTAIEPAVETAAAREVAVPTVEQVAPHPERPIAQPKSILRRAFNAAKVMVPATALGAVFTVGALTALPESFFTVA